LSSKAIFHKTNEFSERLKYTYKMLETSVAQKPSLPTPAWGSAGGFLQINQSTKDLDSDLALDRILIIDRIHRYAWAFDERRIDALNNCFTDDAVWEGNTQGVTPVLPFKGRTTITDWLSGFWAHQTDQRRHVMLNIVVDNQSADKADALVSLMLTAASQSKLEIVLTSFYKLHLEKESDIWRIAHLFEGFDVDF
jgi:ketosteroid isomerase-like protein